MWRLENVGSWKLIQKTELELRSTSQLQKYYLSIGVLVLWTMCSNPSNQIGRDEWELTCAMSSKTLNPGGLREAPSVKSRGHDQLHD